MNDHQRPPLRFAIGCQEVFFLNDADFLAGDCPSNRPDADQPISSSRFQSRPSDWGDETGRGFYASTDTYRSIIQHVINDNSITNYLAHKPEYDQRFELDANGTSRVFKFGWGTVRTVIDYDFYASWVESENKCA